MQDSSAEAKADAKSWRGEISPLRNSSFARIFWAGVASQSGSSVTNVILVFLAYSITHSGFAVALIAISQTVAGVLFSVPMGTFVDRHDRKTLMVVSDVVRAGSVGFLGIFLLLAGFNLVVVIIASFVVAAVGLIFYPAERALVPSMIRRESVPDANGLIYSSRNFIAFGGSALGGALIAIFGASQSLFYNVATFLVSASLLFAIKGAKSNAIGETHPRASMLTEAREGIKWLVSNAGLFQLTMSAMFLNFFFTICSTFLVVYSSTVLGGESVVFGLVLGALVGGQGVGALLVSRTGALQHAGKVWIVGYGIGVGLLVVGLVLFPTAVIALPLTFTMGILGGFVQITWLTTAQLIVPSEVQGRYFGIDTLGSIAIIPLSQLVGGLLVDSHGVLFTYAVAGTGLLATGLLFLLPKGLRGLHVQPSAQQVSQ